MLAAVAAVATPGRALADDDGCELRTLRGTHVFSASGFNIVAGVAQPKAFVQVLLFNGDGTLDVPAATLSINGNVSQTSGGGVYTLEAGCKGTITFSAGPRFDIFTDRKGKQAWAIQTNPGTVFQGTITKVRSADWEDE
jgi:hypothetical protein